MERRCTDSLLKAAYRIHVLKTKVAITKLKEVPSAVAITEDKKMN